jgi:thiol-disulfide isomerase/thioredoxin
MVKKSPDITIVLTKMTWCSHCKDFQEIFDNIKNRLGRNILLKNKEVILETYDMEQSEALFAEKYKDYMSKIDGYPTVFIFIKNNKNKIQGDTIEHTVIEPINNTNKKKLINNATDMFISKVESKYKSVMDENGNEYVNVEAVMNGAGAGNVEAVMNGAGAGTGAGAGAGAGNVEAVINGAGAGAGAGNVEAVMNEGSAGTGAGAGAGNVEAVMNGGSAGAGNVEAVMNGAGAGTGAGAGAGNVEAVMNGGGAGAGASNVEAVINGAGAGAGAGASNVEAVMNGGSIKIEKDYEQKYKKYKIKYLNLLDRYNK